MKNQYYFFLEIIALWMNLHKKCLAILHYHLANDYEKKNKIQSKKLLICKYVKRKYC